MAKDVEFRLTVLRDKNAKARARAFERDMLASQKRYERERLANIKKTEKDQNRIRGKRVQAEIHAQRRQTEEARKALAKRLEAYKRSKRQEVEAEKKAAREKEGILSRFRRKVVGGLPGSGDGGGVGGSVLAGAAGGAAGGGLAGGLARGAGPAGLLAGGVAAVGVSRSAFQQFESEKLRLDALAGGAAAGDELAASLRRVSAETGAAFTQLAKTSAMMQSFNIAAEDSAEAIRAMSIITGGNTERMSRLALAYSQASSMGRLFREEQKQMIEAGFNPLTEIARKTGETVGEVQERLEAGKVGMPEVQAAFTSSIREGGKFEDMLERMANSTIGSTRRMRTAFEEMKIAIGETLADTGVERDLNNYFSRLFKTLGEDVKELEARLSGDSNALVSLAISRKTREIAGSDAPDSELGVFGLAARRSNELDAELNRFWKNREDHLAKEKQAREDEKKHQQRMLSAQSDQVTMAREINSIRVKGAKEELQARRDSLKVAKEASQEARESLMTAQERFGAMSIQEQRQAISTLLTARQQGVRGLSLDQIQTIQSIGTQEAEAISSRALRFRASAAFGPQQAMPDVEFDRRRIRASLFARERQDVRRAQFRETQIQANVQQQIKFVANYENNARQIADRVMELYREANKNQMDEVIQMLQPIREEIATMRRRQQALAPGGRF